MTTSSEELTPLAPDQLDVLRQIGQYWAASPAVQRTRPLPVDPALGAFKPPQPSRFGRFAKVELFRAEEPAELVATPAILVPESRLRRLLLAAKRIVLGPPLPTTAVVQERMGRLVALAVLGSDLLSSVAYGPEAMLSVLVLGGSVALGLSLPLAALLVVLMLAIGASYRQTIRAYPSGAGSYTVAGRNLGPRVGLAAAAGLLTDYVLTVSVSVASGVAAITSAAPSLSPYSVTIGLGVIGVLLAGNLRGVRQAGSIFATPTYAFLIGLLVLIVVGLVQAAHTGFQPRPHPPLHAAEAVTLFLVLRAFSSGATSMTGVEAVSNALPALRPVEWRNGLAVLTWMVGLMVVSFSGLIVMTHLTGVVPRPGETLLSQLGHVVLGHGGLYLYLQITTTLILLLAANTAFNDFPRLLFFMARDGYAPRLFLRLGDRLAFNNGIVALAAVAALLFFAFHGHTEALIPLYAVGVFFAFTLSQTGMVVHWWRLRGKPWRRRLAVNAFGAAACAVVGLTAAVTKFTEGAWVTLLGIGAIVTVCLQIHQHYETTRQLLLLRPLPEPLGTRPFPAPGEGEEVPEELGHLVVVPVARLHRASLRTLAYAASLSLPVFAVHIAPDEDEAERFREEWNAWGNHLWLETIVSPYRAVVPPLAHYLQALHNQRPDITLTVVLYELVARHRWQQVLHSQLGPRLRRALRPLPDIVLSTVPFHLSG